MADRKLILIKEVGGRFISKLLVDESSLSENEIFIIQKELIGLYFWLRNFSIKMGYTQMDELDEFFPKSMEDLDKLQQIHKDLIGLFKGR